MANVHELRDILLEAMAMIDAVLMTEYDPLEVADLNRRAYALMSQQNEQAPAQNERELPDYLNDAIENLVHDNYERSQAGSRNRQADADPIRTALATQGETHE